MVIVHPPPGVKQSGVFDLAATRLCPMASRRQVALVVVLRDRLADMLENYLSVAGRPVDDPDLSGAGHVRHPDFRLSFQAQHRVIAL